MKINTSALHYRLYGLTYAAWGNDPPSRSNLCQYMRRLALSPLILLFPALFISLIGIILVVRAILTYPFGYTTDWKSFALRERSLGLFQVGGFQFYSGYIIIPAALIALNHFIFTHFPGSGEIHLTGYQRFALTTFIFEAVALVMAITFGIVLFFSSDTYDLFSEWFDAKTQGVCPLIEFEGDEDGDQ